MKSNSIVAMNFHANKSLLNWIAVFSNSRCQNTQTHTHTSTWEKQKQHSTPQIISCLAFAGLFYSFSILCVLLLNASLGKRLYKFALIYIGSHHEAERFCFFSRSIIEFDAYSHRMTYLLRVKSKYQEVATLKLMMTTASMILWLAIDLHMRNTLWTNQKKKKTHTRLWY